MIPKRYAWLSTRLAGLLLRTPSNQKIPLFDVETQGHVRLPKLGVFIDFDNVNGGAIPLVFEHLSARWNPTWRRAYGTGLAKHRDLLHASGVLPVEVVPNTRGKNAADFALVIDVVLAACSDSTDAFCIVSSDGDYTRLALTLREKGKHLLIFGRATTPSSLRSACAEFIDIDQLSSRSSKIPLHKSPLATIPAPVDGGSGFMGGANEPHAPGALHHNGGERPFRSVPAPLRVDAAELIPLILDLIGNHGKTTLTAIQSMCSSRYTNFSPRMCGVTKWCTLLRVLAIFTVVPIKSKAGRIMDYEIRLTDLPPEALTDQSAVDIRG